MERAIRTQSSSAVTSHAAQEAVFTLFVALLGLSLTGGAVLINRSPLLFFAVILGAAVLFVIAAGMLSRWFRKYGRRRSRHGNLARGQLAAVFAFLVLLLQAAGFAALFGLSLIGWRGF